GERSMGAETYWTRLQPRLATWGITRVADITGLDRAGLPVAQAIRPLARSNAANQGKGRTLAHAAIAATLEAIETAVGEHFAPGAVVDVTASQAGVVPACYSPHLPDEGSAIPPDETLPWLWGVDLDTLEPEPVPAALVSTDYTLTSPHMSSPLARSTTGLGAGASLADALRHAILEVIEREATGDAMATIDFFELARFNPARDADAELAVLIDRLCADGFLIGAYRLPVAAPFQGAWVRVMEATHSPLGLPFPADGFSCRSTMGAAVRAALEEALQTRLSVIAGAREDITRRFYPRHPPDNLQTLRDALSAPVPGGERVPRDQPAPAGSDALKALAGHGRRALAVPLLSDPDVPLHVVRIIPVAVVAP
ncbi:MAG: YcaO-like family protein, partial [Pseudomonadota bacterium]